MANGCRAYCALGILSLALGAPSTAYAQDWLFLDGIADGEFWTTDTHSPLLTRDDGHPAVGGRLQIFAGAAIGSSLQLLTLGELEGGKGSEEGDVEVSVDQAMLRYVHSSALVVELGRFPTPVGSFPPRRFSTRNPLIGTPDGFPVGYPWGAQLGGSGSHLDYRLALVSLPWTHAEYVPDPGFAVRPVLGIGVTPQVGLRLGASFTRGPYLSSNLNQQLPGGANWKDFDQRVIAFDGGFSRGYFESHAELAFLRYEVPGQSGSTDALSWYVEFKYTWGPRLFTALRLERNKYATIKPIAGNPWMVQTFDLHDGEIGIGYRIASHAIAKATYRRDHWRVSQALSAQYQAGNAVALQFSQEIDIVALIRGRASEK